MVTDNEIVAKYFRSSKGIRGVAKLLGVGVVRVSVVITKYKKKKTHTLTTVEYIYPIQLPVFFFYDVCRKAHSQVF
jgi:hypothetical protein